ncbi:MAG TPA: class I SAM-dependent methyltransferase [Ilumatobacteraceae bacterium]
MVLSDLLPHLRTPCDGVGPVHILEGAFVTIGSGGQLLTATLVGPNCEDPSRVDQGIWDAMGGASPARTPAQLSNVLPPTAQLYERAWRTRSLSLLSGRPFPLADELAELDEAVGDVHDSVVVDIGTSEGLYARHLAGRGALVLAVDHSRPFLRRSIRRASLDGVAIAPTRALAQRLPLLDHAADAVVIGGSLNELGDLDAAMAEVARVLRPDGVLFLVSLVAAQSRLGRAAQRALRAAGIVFPTPGATGSLLERHGLVVTRTRQERIVLRTTARAVSSRAHVRS